MTSSSHSDTARRGVRRAASAPSFWSLVAGLFLLALAVPSGADQGDTDGGLLFVASFQKDIIVVDEERETVIDRIRLKTDGIASAIQLSYDKKKVYATTHRKGGFEVIDIATRKVINHFSLNDDTRTVRLRGFAPGPEDRLVYAIISVAILHSDRFEIEDLQFAVIDLEKNAITATAPFPKGGTRPPWWGTALRVSPDGKLLYVFLNEVRVFDTSDFSLVDTIELSRPIYRGMAGISFGLYDDPYEDRGTVTGIFSSIDPIVGRKTFGIARFDLNKRTFEFYPVGPAATPGSPVHVFATEGMTALQVTPDGKKGYAVAFQGGIGNRRCEFWVFDMATRKVTDRVEFEGPVNFNFTLSGDGKKIYLDASVATLEVYDAVTLKRRGSIDLGAARAISPLVIPRSNSPRP